MKDAQKDNERSKEYRKNRRKTDPEWYGKTKARTKEWCDNNKEYLKAKNKKYRNEQKENRNSIDVIARFKSTSLRANAKKRGLDVTVVSAELKAALIAQNKKCALSGRELEYSNGGLNSPSVDRLDNRIGYHADNIRWVTYQANMARSNGTDAELLSFCKDVLEHHGYAVTKPVDSTG